jgi:alpha-galactosidase
MLNKFRRLTIAVRLVIFTGTLLSAVPGAAQQLSNDKLSLTVDAKSGTYQFAVHDEKPGFTSRVAAQVNHEWLRSSDYPRHQATESAFTDELGSGHAISLTCRGLAGKADLDYIVQMYDQRPFATVQVFVRNSTGEELTIQAIRSVEAIGEPALTMGGAASADRVLSDSFSEDWPPMQLYDLGKAPDGTHRAVGSQLIYNRESKQSAFFGALTSDRFLTIFHLATKAAADGYGIAGLTADSTGTTEIQATDDGSGIRQGPKENIIELSLPLAPGAEMHSERVMLQGGPDYHAQLLAYGDAIRTLHRARILRETPIGWWSWTAYYGGINEGETLANADWQSEHLKSLGYKYFQIDEGYQYARGEYSTENATQFPDGLRFVGRRITADGLTFGIWTGPFEVTSRAWVYEHHKDWLVHNAKGEPIPGRRVWNQKTDTLYALDTTHPGAQEYLRQTYRTLVREWGVRFIKLDFMDTTAIEGFRYRPNTTAMEAQRIGLQIIRDAVGEDVVLDKDGSPMLNAVGLVDTGRISTDTSHAFEGTKEAGTGIAARFYMHRNFFVNDPDAFNTVSESFMNGRKLPASLALSAAQASIALSAVSGGMYEIGDDMVVLGSQKDRLALVENRDLLNMAKIGRASTPVDLMTYEAADEQPSIFILKESPRQAILTVFNWTKAPRSHTLPLGELGLAAQHTDTAIDVLDQNAAVTLAGGAVRIENQPPESVRVIKLIDSGVAPGAPSVTAKVPAAADAGETVHFSAEADGSAVPAVEYHWDFGDGTAADGPSVSHAYTYEASFPVRLRVDGADGVPAVQNFSVKVSGKLRAFPNLSDNKRFRDPADH